MSGEVVDSPDRSVAEHVRRYLATDGRDGYLEGGVPNLVLTVTGRTSGRRFRTGLFYGTDGDRYVLVASGSAFGTATPPSWYRNLVVNPLVEVQIRGERFTATARTAAGAERERLWDLMTGLAPEFHAYAARSPRTIPVVVLERS
ncbi:nitroreductase/quinone reductase family protein [Jiangella endophytica]|uniref:nitroreductase/quinone reductase family protein n=1 Tax=Jiangella endophytica TaxID=1623398 RepID=UPI000E340F8E|nr:nitroreductase/quinone reductase family protein [Jiangella endophytica]